jgi:diguanylate cyclase (GGDEF)-like protein
MRIAFTVILGCMVVALVVCAHKARRARRSIGTSVMHLLLALIPPIIGNLLLIISTNRTLSTVGCYIYFLGMDLVMLAVAQFAGEYCSIRWPKGVPAAVAALLGLDAIQLLTNIFTGHAFGTEEIAAYGAPYFRLIPYFGQTVHRVVDYGILAAVIVIFIVKIVRSPRIESERYVVILATMVVTAIWETLYIFSRTPVDRSMVGFGVFGLLVYYFSLYYRPLRLLDRLLATVASEIPDALFFFDLSGHCIWANKRGIELAGIEGGEFEAASERLIEKLGELGPPDENWSGTHLTGSGEAVESYVMERRTVTDDRGRVIGSFLTVRDNSDEQKLLQREIYNATHDSLTQVYNRAGYDLLLSRIDLKTTTLLLIDGDNFKQINDTYGHEVGDRTLQKVARAIVRDFRSEDYVCRVGGDEFVVLETHAARPNYDHIRERIRRINAELADGSDGVPPISVSAGVAHGSQAADGAALFELADRALYETKRSGRSGLTVFSES